MSERRIGKAGILRAAAIGLALTTGCGEVLGVSGYSIEPPPSDAGGLPDSILPAKPDPGDVACEACVWKNCATERAACFENAAARALFDCTRHCSDPSCLSTCRATHPVSVAFDDYFDCAFNPGPTKCDAECKAGFNFACTGADTYSWPEQGGLTHLKIELSDLLSAGTGAVTTYTGLEVSDCGETTANADPPGDYGCFGWSDLGTYGSATLSPVYGDAIALRDKVGLHGQRLYPGPFPSSSSSTMRFLVLDRGLVVLTADQPPPASRGIVNVNQVDCLGVSATIDTHVALDPPASTPVYVTPGPNTSPEYHSGALVMFFSVPPARSVLVTSTTGGKPLSKTSVLVGAQWVTAVTLFPMDRREARN